MKPNKVRQSRSETSRTGSVHLLWALVLLPYRLLGMLRGTEVKFVQILHTGHQIFQGVAGHLCQGLGLRKQPQNNSILCLQHRNLGAIIMFTNKSCLIQHVSAITDVVIC